MLPDLNFSDDDLTPKEVSVTLGKEKLVLAEMSAAAAAVYDNRKMAGATLQEDGTAKINNFADLRILAVALCLHPADWDRKTELTPDELDLWERRIRALPDRITDPIHDALLEISPTLAGTPDLDDLYKQRDRVNALIVKLENKKNFNPKGSPAAGTPGSSTAAS